MTSESLDNQNVPEATPAAAPQQKKKRKRPGFFAGFLTGLILTLLGALLYVGRFFVPLPIVGTVVITLPTYEVFHRLPEGSLVLIPFRNR